MVHLLATLLGTLVPVGNSTIPNVVFDVTSNMACLLVVDVLVQLQWSPSTDLDPFISTTS